MTSVLVPPQVGRNRTERLPRWQRPASPVPPPAPWRSQAARALIALGLLAISFVAYVTVIAGLQENRRQDVLYAQLRSELAHGVAPVAGPVEVGKPVAILAIPRLGVRDVVVEGSDGPTLRNGPGHVGGTPLPGQPGAAVVFGRRASFGAPFRHLDRLAVGDTITVTTGQGRFDFTVDETWRSTDPHDVPKQSAARLTLVTSDPSLLPTQSLVVTAAIRGQAAAAGALTAAQSDGLPLTSSHSSGIATYLWAQALLVVALIGAWAWHRWPRAVVWMGGVPLVLAIVWNLFDSVAAMLPNTL